MGASAWYGHWLGRVEDLRGRVAPFWGSRPAEVALLPSTSAALAVVSESVRPEGRNRVVCTELDFPTLLYQWAVKPEIELVVLKSRDGVASTPSSSPRPWTSARSSWPRATCASAPGQCRT